MQNEIEQSDSLKSLRAMLEADRREAQSWLMSGKTPDSLSIREAMDDEHILQQEHADIYGGCSMGCDASQLVQCHSGVVCNWTRRPCPKFALPKILEAYSVLNKNSVPSLALLERTK